MQGSQATAVEGDRSLLEEHTGSPGQQKPCKQDDSKRYVPEKIWSFLKG